MDASIDEETRKSLNELRDIFGQEDGDKIFTILKGYVTDYTKINGSMFPITLIQIIDIPGEKTRDAGACPLSANI